MESLTATELFIGKRLIMIAGPFLLGLAWLRQYDLALGGLAGVALGLFNLHMLGKALISAVQGGFSHHIAAPGEHTSTGDRTAIDFHVTFHYLLRYILTGLALYWALKFGMRPFLASVLGMMGVKAVILLHAILGYRGGWE